MNTFTEVEEAKAFFKENSDFGKLKDLVLEIGAKKVDVIHDTNRKIEQAEENLVANARSIISKMEQLILEVEKRGISASINSLGELQGRSSDLETSVGKFCEVRESIVTIHKLLQ